MRGFSCSAFTLIELLVVIAIIAILAVVVVLTLNPAEMLRQGRDSSRVSDVDTLVHTLSLYQADQSGAIGYFMGNASSVYLSLPDPTISGSATSSCAYWGLPALPTGTGYAYQCSSPQNYRNTNGSGWIPINFSTISSGNPLGSLPADSANTSSTGFYYTYSTDGNSYEVTSLLESQKYKAQYAQSPMAPGYPEVNAKGSSLSVSPIFNPSGLVDWWPMNEGTGTVSFDQGASGNNLTLHASTMWATSGCKVGGSCLSVPGTIFYDAASPTGSNFVFTNQNFSFVIWENVTGNNVAANGNSQSGGACQSAFGGWLLQLGTFLWCTPAQIGVATQGAGLTVGAPAGVWNQIAISFNSSGNVSSYVNGVLKGSVASNGIGYQGTTSNMVIGCQSNGANCIIGSENDARLYNRALSAAEIQALYNAEK